MRSPKFTPAPLPAYAPTTASAGATSGYTSIFSSSPGYSASTPSLGNRRTLIGGAS
jgi:hypothetical protein